MASAVYLEHYLDKLADILETPKVTILKGLETLPAELQRNFKLMRDLDTRTQDLLKEIDRLADDYLKNVKNMSADQRAEQMDKIKTKFGKTKEYGDDKVQLAMQTYEMVDKHIRRLDADLARFEADIKDKALNVQSSDSESSQKICSNSPLKGKGRKSKDKIEKKKGRGRTLSSDDDIPKSARKKIKSPAAPVVEAILPSLSIAHPSDVLDMPVDPNEPTYCLCHQVSYGEMIGCDNPDCPIEWFHFACVGLTSKPKGKWFCPKCSAERKKK